MAHLLIYLIIFKYVYPRLWLRASNNSGLLTESAVITSLLMQTFRVGVSQTEFPQRKACFLGAVYMGGGAGCLTGQDVFYPGF